MSGLRRACTQALRCNTRQQRSTLAQDVEVSSQALYHGAENIRIYGGPAECIGRWASLDHNRVVRQGKLLGGSQGRSVPSLALSSSLCWAAVERQASHGQGPPSINLCPGQAAESQGIRSRTSPNPATSSQHLPCRCPGCNCTPQDTRKRPPDALPAASAQCPSAEWIGCTSP